MSDGVTFPIPEKEVYKLVKKGFHTMFKGNPSREQFDDLVQDCMIRIMEVMPLYDEKKGSFSNFVYMQVRWTIWRDMVHYNAKSRMRDYMINSLDFVSPNNDEDESVMNTFADNKPVQDLEEELRLQEVFKHFTKEEIKLIIDYFFLKRRPSEMAEKQNTSRQAMGNRLNKIRKRLKEVLDESTI